MLSRSMSANTGIASAYITATAPKTMTGSTITSSPGPAPEAITEAWSTDIAEFIASARFVPTASANSSSNWATYFPRCLLLVVTISSNISSVSSFKLSAMTVPPVMIHFTTGIK